MAFPQHRVCFDAVFDFLQASLPPPKRAPDAVVTDCTTRDQVSVGLVAEETDSADNVWVKIGHFTLWVSDAFEKNMKKKMRQKCGARFWTLFKKKRKKKRAECMMQQKIKKKGE